MTVPMSDLPYGPGNEFLGLNRAIVPFVACGDLSGLDADQSYPLPAAAKVPAAGAPAPESTAPASYTYIPPVQAPIKPAYAEYLATRKAGRQDGSVPPRDAVEKPAE